MNRKRFFTSVSIAAAGLALTNIFPLNFFKKSSNKAENKITLKANPLSVSRKKIGDRNV